MLSSGLIILHPLPQRIIHRILPLPRGIGMRHPSLSIVLVDAILVVQLVAGGIISDGGWRRH